MRHRRIRLLLPWAWALSLALASSASAQEAHPSPEAAVPLAPGDAIPSAGVRTVTGEPADLAELVRDAGALLVFYRGGW